MIIVKTEKQIEAMRESGKILRDTLLKAEEFIKPGITTKELDKYLHRYIISRGAKPSCLGYEGYPAATCISVNEVVVHGIPGDRVINDGDIVSVDLCVLYKGMHTDAARTFCVGNVSPEKRKLVEVTKESFFEGIKHIKSGCRVGDIGSAVQKYAESFGYGVVRDLQGHGVGCSIHEDPGIPNFGRAGTGEFLKEGMTIAVEPMITLGTYEVSVAEDGWTVFTDDGEPAAHYENTMVVTKDGVEILTL